MGEFDLIARIRARAPTRADVLLGIGDDAALLLPPAGLQLVVAMDTLNAGVHFPPATAPADIGWKALAVNLSDLAAMGAQPAWCTLSLSMPEAQAGFVDGFLDGFLALAAQYDVALVGGDTTRGPLSVCVAVHGLVEPGMALRRDGARAGDEVWVSGSVGDAAAALVQWKEGCKGGQLGCPAEAQPDPLSLALRARLDRPTPRVALGRALRGVASACIDVSDGLLADLGHVCAASGVAATVDVDALPASEALRASFSSEHRRHLQATGGDDYELCFSAAADAHAVVLRAAATAAVAVTRIGRILPGAGVAAHTADTDPWSAPATGWVHFA
ncbi:MAG: thiamine-phosphate kinase [Thermomonas sp.]|jgi:thiamine-monophosphate kinase|uniref:thiamine-phosphate kinase n=1 Tax=Thermomonas sp. TaxID=1971895 RepID=UPI001B475EAD|nr:thiamine-phosphate kinase [Thermomonas sp.]MBK6333622.1 thiamine-phosphate kinase [Thermomonas sp.]MBK7205239.1 thiamine-phosphate kinase [Thermomonas sp.]MBP7157831.1 thiamine-phosphate kinase [Thermomonas sp.]MBP7788607.1 thiamine-phosphate kinase [Thermomonas sp.]MBP8648230.1 thiamine-phosphate kinase [Thermomonas sp.]